MPKISKAHDPERAELEAFVELLNTNEGQALAQEAALRKKAKPFILLAEKYLMIAVIAYLCLLGGGVTAIVNVGLSDAAKVFWFCVGLAQLFLVLYGLSKITGLVATARRNWSVPLLQGGLCLSMEKLLSSHPGEQLLRATVRPLYRADYLLAGYIAADVSRLAAQKRKVADEKTLRELEARACVRLHAKLTAELPPSNAPQRAQA